MINKNEQTESTSGAAEQKEDDEERNIITKINVITRKLYFKIFRICTT